jgi:hypothetical protein
LKDYISNAERKPVIEEYKNTLINRYKNQFAGMLPAYSALKGKEEAGQIPPVLEELFTELSENAAKNKSKIQQKMEKAKNKFVFLDEN